MQQALIALVFGNALVLGSPLAADSLRSHGGITRRSQADPLHRCGPGAPAPRQVITPAGADGRRVRALLGTLRDLSHEAGRKYEEVRRLLPDPNNRSIVLLRNTAFELRGRIHSHIREVKFVLGSDRRVACIVFDARKRLAEPPHTERRLLTMLPLVEPERAVFRYSAASEEQSLWSLSPRLRLIALRRLVRELRGTVFTLDRQLAALHARLPDF